MKFFRKSHPGTKTLQLTEGTWEVSREDGWLPDVTVACKCHTIFCVYLDGGLPEHDAAFLGTR